MNKNVSKKYQYNSNLTYLHYFSKSYFMNVKRPFPKVVLPTEEQRTPTSLYGH